MSSSGFRRWSSPIMLLVSLGYWMISTLVGVDVSGDLGGNFVGALGLHLMPISLVVTIVSLVGWSVSVVGMVLLRSADVFGIVTAVPLLLASLVLGVLASGRASRLLAR